MIYENGFTEAEKLTNRQIDTARAIIEDKFSPDDINNAELVARIAHLLAINYQSFSLDTSD